MFFASSKLRTFTFVVLGFFALFSGHVSFAKTAAEIQATVDQVQRQVFSDIIRYSDQLGITVYVGGSTATQLAFFSPPKEEGAHLSDFMASGQDIDLCIDGSRGQLEKFRSWLQTNHPQYEWDVGLRRLIENENFRLQNSDSLSTTYLRLSSKPGEAAFLDFRRTDHDPKAFLEDVSKRQIHFLSSGHHRETKLYRENKNPEIFSVIRYLVNIAKFEVLPVPEDIDAVNQLIEDFDSPSNMGSDYANRRAATLLSKFERYRNRLKDRAEAGEKLVDFQSLRKKFRKGSCALSSILASLKGQEAR